ncbi:MAG TPA: hypothetical protein VD932_04030 [Aquabacterium sp.]|nr:hypothetical protein [Aquabacterium sp.]
MQHTVDADRLRYLRIVIEAYVRWREDVDHLGYVQFAQVVGMPQVIEQRRVVDLSEDEFTIVDRAFAAMDPRDRDLIEVEYTRECHPKEKAADCGYVGDNVAAAIAWYRRDLLQAESRMYLALQPYIDEWELAKPMRRRSG